MKRLSFGALTIGLAIAAPAMAQSTPATQPAPMTSQPATDARSAGADAAVTSGMPVRDNTGAFIGSISSVQAAPNGGQMAVIKMGAKTFSVATNALLVSGGTATVNASESQIERMMQK